MFYHQLKLAIAGPHRETVIQRLWDMGSLGLVEEERDIVAYFPDSLTREAVLMELQIAWELLKQASGAPPFTFDYSIIKHADWNVAWKRGFKPIAVGERFTILPPWEEPVAGRINLIIDPGMAFGTGHHETTRSCLVLMERYAPQGRRERFLDLGTGTGLLAIAAAKSGFHEILGIDNDPLAIDAAQMNAAANDAGAIRFILGEIDQAEGLFDMIAANIISGTLVLLAGPLAARLHSGGLAILSGILQGQEDEVIEAFEQAGLACSERYADGKWMSLVMKKP